jgi:hypothetical protein
MYIINHSSRLVFTRFRLVKDLETERNFVDMMFRLKRVYPEVSGLAAWRKNSKRYSSLPLGAVVSLFHESV